MFSQYLINLMQIACIYQLHPPFHLITIHKTIKCGDKSAVERWLDEEGKKLNECIDGRASHGHFFVGDGTALHWAAYHGQLEIARLLLDNGAGTYLWLRFTKTKLCGLTRF